MIYTPEATLYFPKAVMSHCTVPPPFVVVSKKGQVIRTGANEVPALSRATQGVRIMKMRAGDSIASMVAL